MYTRNAKEDAIIAFFNEIKIIPEDTLPKKSIYIKLEDEKIISFLIEDPADFPHLMREAYIKYLFDVIPAFTKDEIQKEYKNTKIRFTIPNVIKIQEVTPKLENIPVSFDCIILGVDERKTFVKKCKIFCKKCELEMKRDGSYRNPPELNCDKCGRICEVMPSSIESEYVQTVILQEPLEESKSNSPVTFIGKLTGDLVGDVFVSQRKRVVGVFRSVVVPKKMENDINIDIISVDDLGEVKYSMPPKGELEWLKGEVKKPEFFDKLASSFAPYIFGHKEIKKSILLQLAGGTRLDMKRGIINILLLGDPSMAKSQLLKFAQSITEKSMYTSGKGASNAGLTIGIVKRSDGTNLAQAGILPLCNDGFAFIDELDKMLDHDRSGLHEAMEQGTCSISKAGIALTLPSRASVLAAANPKTGRWNTDLRYVQDNVNLSTTLLSRFDIKWLMRDVADDVRDTHIAAHILEQYEKKDECYMSKEQMTSYFNYIRKLEPKMSKEANGALMRFYKKIRSLAKEQNIIQIDTRQLEGLIRMSIAHAKILMKEKVDESDVLIVLDIYKQSLSEFGIDFDKNVVDTSKIFGTSAELSKKETFDAIFEKLKEGDGFVNSKRLVEELSKTKYYSEEQAIAEINKRKLEIRLLEPRADGRLKRAPN